KELNVLAGEIREKIGKKLEVDRFYLSDSLAEAKDQLRLIREKRSFVQLTMAGTNLLHLSFTKGKDIRSITLNEECRVTEISLIDFEFGNRRILNKFWCQGSSEGVCDEYKSLF
ncbi:MAG: hypothetical protein KDD50_03285, partial [Bdellovibrionales bacterium]|nr:hypothetical protein [Bdellovibrionales bacterium]